MRNQLKDQAQLGTSFPGEFLAPTGGWNARDPIASMKKTDAILLDNLFPRTSDVTLRKGFELFSTLPADIDASSPHNVGALMSYSPPSGNLKLFAGLEDGIYDITAGGVVSAISSACTNRYWQYINVTTAGGSFLWCCNGVDKSRIYDGSNWTLLDSGSSPALTGITSEDITNVSLHKARVYLCKKDSLSFYYLPAASIAGAASEYPMGAIFKRGGYLIATESWTLDGGTGSDDYFVAITSEGEVAIFAGTDPANANTWALQGLYFIGKPLSRKCFCKFGGDLIVLTVQGAFPLSKALIYASISKTYALTDKISRAWTDFSSLYKHLPGWQAISYPSANFFLVNVPVINNQALGAFYSYQFVMNTQTGAWCRFTGQNSESWVEHDGELYFGNHNKVYKAWTGYYDEQGAISVIVKTAFDRVGRGNMCRATLIQPIFQGTGELELLVGVDVDFEDASLGSSSISYANELALYDSAIWDQSVWASGGRTITDWISVNHRPGKNLALRMKFDSYGIPVSWITTNLILQRGGIF